MKKLISIILSITLIAMLGIFSVSAESFDICGHTVGDACDGYVSDANAARTLHSGSASTLSHTCYTTAEIYAYGHNFLGEANPGFWSSAYTSTYAGSAFDNYQNFSCSHSAYGGK